MTIGMKGPGLYIQGEGELDKLGKYVKKLGDKFLIICSPNNHKRVYGRIAEALKSVEKEAVYAEFSGKCTKEAIQAAVDQATETECDVIVGVGGGTALDTAKAVATNMGGKACVIIPTIASNDAPCTSVAVIYNEEHVVIKALMMRRNPDVVVVDTGVIAQAPKSFLISGIGDALATYFETRACMRIGATSMARGKVSHTAIMMCQLCYDLLLKFSLQALADVDRHEVTPELESVVEACTYLSGVGFECGGLAAAHAINDGFAFVPQASGMSHGKKVAYGLLAQLKLEKAPVYEQAEVRNFIKAVGLPSCLADLGIKDVHEEEIRQVAKAACAPKQSTRNSRADITEEDVYNAIMDVDAEE